MTATLNEEAREGQLPRLAEGIVPGVAAARRAGEIAEGSDGAAVDQAARVHAKAVAAELAAAEPFLAPRVNEGVLKVLPAYYDLVAGTVDWFETD